jgi:hypothetical protein
MLLIVFGAGASYDSVPSRNPRSYSGLERRPPLANQLFDDRALFTDVMKSWPQCQPIIPYLRNLPSGVSLERRLEELQNEAPSYPARYSQLAAVRYYLQLMLQQCERFWLDDARGITNYKTLLDEVEAPRANRYLCSPFGAPQAVSTEAVISTSVTVCRDWYTVRPTPAHLSSYTISRP